MQFSELLRTQTRPWIRRLSHGDDKKIYTKTTALTEWLRHEEMAKSQAFIMWEQLSENARTALQEMDFGEAVSASFITDNFEANLKNAWPFLKVRVVKAYLTIHVVKLEC